MLHGVLLQKHQQKNHNANLFGFGTNLVTISAGNYSPFEKKILACYWAFIPAEELTMSYQVTMWSELPIMNLELLDTSSHKDQMGKAAVNL